MLNLRELLQVFEGGESLSLGQISRSYGVEPGVLEGMLDFWVRKGRLREAPMTGCAECGVKHACPVAINLPRRFEIAHDDRPAVAACPARTVVS